MYKYFNSIVVCHRKRRFALRAFLRAFSLAVKYVDKDSFEIVITDMDESSDSLIKRYTNVLNINHCKVKYDGIFCRGRALNHSVLNAKGKYITVLDIDSIITNNFISGIEEFYKNGNMERSKLSHRVKKLDYKFSLDFLFSNFEETLIEQVLINYNIFHILRERYTENEVIYDGGNIDPDLFNGRALGNSQFTMLRSIFMELGGYDERFIGHGCEDLDFNRRAYQFLKCGYIRSEPKYSIYHLKNTSSLKNYKNAKISNDNGAIYLSNKKNNVIFIPINDNWGKF